MSKSYDLGRKGEALAAEFLAAKGFKILARNFRAGKAEIDIVASDKGTLVIAEVKTRNTRYFGEPEVWVNPAKQKLLIKAANAYVKFKAFKGEVRFDVVSVIIDEKGTEIVHIPDAFYPTL
ncbi:MAG: YraN family protein [Bacteroidetes bacterium]|nr:YraN family protein [Bacteroidota bacterium]